MNADIDTAEAERFLRALGGRFTFQTFDDSRRKDRRLSRVLHGTLAQHADTLANLQARGAGVFVMVNEGDGKGRSERNVQRSRAYFADFDGAQPPDVATVPLRPHCIVESSPNRWHWYWWIEGAPLATFKAVQVAIAARYGSDARVNDLPRVMRLPGFFHRKREPFRTRIVELRNAPRYTHAEFVAAFQIEPAAACVTKTRKNGNRSNVTRLPTAQRHKRTLPDAIPEGERNSTLLSLAGGLVRDGHNLQGVTDRLQRINAERCKPPLRAMEVDGIAARAVAYGSEGFVILPHALLDSPEWKALAPPAHDIVLIAFRRYNGANNGNIALTWADFDGLPGFGDDETFYRHRKAAANAGILRVTQTGKRSQQGMKPTLYAIAERFLPIPLTRKIRASANPEIPPSYIDKQSLEAVLLLLQIHACRPTARTETENGANDETETIR